MNQRKEPAAAGLKRGESERARMKDVARMAGVSAMTVSRALRNPAQVARETRERINAAIAELGYVPDLVAGSLSSKRSGVIAAIVPTLSNSIFADTLEGLSDCLNRQGYQLLLGNTGYSSGNEEALVAAIIGRRPEGVMLIGGQHTEATRRMLRRARVPVVETWDIPKRPVDMAVGFSNFEGARMMTRFLVEAGYGRIGFAGGAPGDIRGQQRRAGYLSVIKELGLPDNLTVSVGEHPFKIQNGAEALARLLDLHPETDALMCVSDIPAVGALMECLRRHLAVPGRIAVAGFGDFEIAAQVVPGLTTVQVSGYEMGRRAGQLLIDRLNGAPLETQIVEMDLKIIRRGSA